MDTNFPRFNKLWGKPVFQFEDGSSLQVTSALYFDLFTSGAEFLGFHIPSSAHVLEVCALLAEHAIELGDALANGGLSIIAESPGENPQTLSDLRYSGKVYLYHEDAFTHRQMAEVEGYLQEAPTRCGASWSRLFNASLGCMETKIAHATFVSSSYSRLPDSMGLSSISALEHGLPNIFPVFGDHLMQRGGVGNGDSEVDS